MLASTPQPMLTGHAIWALGTAGLAAHSAYILLGVGRGVADGFVSSWVPFGVFHFSKPLPLDQLANLIADGPPWLTASPQLTS